MSVREIHTKHSDGFKVGDVVQLENKISKEIDTILFINSVETVQGYDKSYIQKCNNTLKFYKNGILFQIPCIVSDGTISDDSGKYMALPGNQIMVKCPNLSATDVFVQGLRFILGKNVYKILSTPQDVVEVGLLKVKMEWTEKDSRDDFVNGVAWNEGIVIPSYSLKILNTKPLLLNLYQRPELSIEVKMNDIIVSSPSLTYESSDSSICTIENGIVTPISIGNCTITVKLAENTNVQDTINVEVMVMAQNNYAVEFDSSSPYYIYKNKTASYKCIFKNNGELITEQSQFYLTADDGVSTTTLAQISFQNSVENTCTILAGSTSGYIKLWVKNINNTIVCTNPLRIQIKSLV